VILLRLSTTQANKKDISHDLSRNGVAPALYGLLNNKNRAGSCAGWSGNSSVLTQKSKKTTNPDGWTRVTTYGGCGCAGGDVATVQDEHGRQRRYTKDALSRLAKVEEMSWGGSSVYATTIYSYNVRDQITQSNQAGQDRSFNYDGYGRLQSRTTPEQGTANFTYNADDTTNVFTDARGATTTYSYNARHSVTGINYGVPGGVASTSNVSFGYDAAGNRTSVADGLGSMVYNYDNLSQLTSETRNFNALGSYGSYTLSYAYNLAGELSTFTNPWSAQVSYAYDKAGRVTARNSTRGLVWSPLDRILEKGLSGFWVRPRQVVVAKSTLWELDPIAEVPVFRISSKTRLIRRRMRFIISVLTLAPALLVISSCLTSIAPETGAAETWVTLDWRINRDALAITCANTPSS
jgi:YD repeat-containing protein